MPSSTSNFERGIPGGSWGKTWIAVIALVVPLVVALELGVRARGFEPSVTDDAHLWAWQRTRASDRSPSTVVLIGASRILLAFSPQAFTEELPGRRYVQLAIQGTSPVAALRDLALDPAFRGVVIADFAEYMLAFDPWSPWPEQLHAYHRRWRAPGAMAERWLATHVQSRLALLAVDGLRTTPRYVTMAADRTRYADYRKTDVSELREVQEMRVGNLDLTEQDPRPWLVNALQHEMFVALIQARGGKVVYLRMPTCDARWAADEAMLPKAKFWDVLARHTRATTIHFRDHAELSGFACPDTSHLDSKDGPRFTRGLIAVLRARGVL